MLLPIFMFGILKQFDEAASFWTNLKFAVFMVLGISINCVIHHSQFMISNWNGIKMRIALSGLIYNKVTNLYLLIIFPTLYMLQ